jgi:hypothetical protein
VYSEEWSSLSFFDLCFDGHGSLERESNKALVLEAFDTLFNQRDYAKPDGISPERRGVGANPV